MADSRTIRVFIASPGDLAVERAAFKQVIDELNGGFGDGAKVKYEALGWEDTLASTGRRSQSVINREIDRCDVFVLAMHRRWGQEAPDAKPYSSYTEEEFHRAYDRWQKKPKRGQRRAPEIFVFFKHIDPGQMADAGPQLQKVLDFRRQLEESRQVLYRLFANEQQFKAEINNHLRAYAKGELPQADAPRDKVLLPLAVIEAVAKERAEKERALALAKRDRKVAKAAVARAEKLALVSAVRAAKAALEGRVEEARQDFAKATDGTTNLQVLYLAYDFYKRTGDLATAEELVLRRLAISGRNVETAETARALGNLGVLYKHRGELDQAEELHREALAIDEKLGNQEGIARHCANLGLIYYKRRKLDRAKKMHQKALAIDEKLGHQEGIARDCGNLGMIYAKRGALDRAEEMFKKSLAINEKLGLQQGVANQYANLGDVAKDRGDVQRARELGTKARDLFAKIGMPHMVKKVQDWLDGRNQREIEE